MFTVAHVKYGNVCKSVLTVYVYIYRSNFIWNYHEVQRWKSLKYLRIYEMFSENILITGAMNYTCSLKSAVFVSKLVARWLVTWKCCFAAAYTSEETTSDAKGKNNKYEINLFREHWMSDEKRAQNRTTEFLVLGITGFLDFAHRPFHISACKQMVSQHSPFNPTHWFS